MKTPLLLATAVLLTSCATVKIQDCPDEKIINKMPQVGGQGLPSEYYIYKGERKEITDFDQEWLKKNCPSIRVQEVY
ncbi:hypothetical protein [Chryseobacterium taklimakanense]|uniref:hypothetical protein n=1 Tax=Chryseobacterium taklimakanense TaxID=536441 RepID=UPI0023F92F74|nr:hypothetical protein [Chryseobacterium taklimakanense]